MNKPNQIELISLDGKIIGAIMQDDNGYFYRPKRNTIPKGRKNKWDGDYHQTVTELKKTLY